MSQAYAAPHPPSPTNEHYANLDASCRVEAAHPSSSNHPMSQQAFQAPAAPFRVLIVDDNPINRKVLEMPLKKAGIETLQACDGLEAVQLYAQARPDLVLMDITMPVMDGWQAAREIRNFELAQAIQVTPTAPANSVGKRTRIVATTLCSESDLQRGQEAGMDDWLVKPVRSAVLVQDVLAFKQSLSK